MKRRLAAILAADVVGFSRLMGVDEAGTLRRLGDLRKSVLEPLISQYDGRLFKLMGDGMLVEFSSVVDAVACALAWQEKSAHAALIEEMKPLQFRIGINLGDVIVENDDFYGDGVNIASRLESIAEPGGVCISEKVYDELKNKLDVEFVDGGVQKLKNIQRPIRVYHNHADSPVQTDEGDTSQYKATETKTLRVAVKSTTAVGDNNDLVALAQGLGPAIADGLSRSSVLDVTTDGHEAADFVLESTARALGSRLRLSFSLNDIASKKQIWAERYDRTIDDLFDLEDEIAQVVAYTVRINLMDAGSRHLSTQDVSEYTGPDLLAKAAGYLTNSYKDIGKANEIIELALLKMPDSAMAHAMAAAAQLMRAEESPLRLGSERIKSINTHIDTALSLDGSDFFSHLVKGLVLGDLHKDFEQAKMHAELALGINPQLLPARIMVANADCQLGRNGDALDKLQNAIKADRTGPHRHRHGRELAVCLLMAGREQQAVDVIRRVVAQAPELRRNEIVLAATFALSGSKESATQTVASLIREFPELSVSTLRPTAIANSEVGERFVSALVECGLPKD